MPGKQCTIKARIKHLTLPSSMSERVDTARKAAGGIARLAWIRLAIAEKLTREGYWPNGIENIPISCVKCTENALLKCVAGIRTQRDTRALITKVRRLMIVREGRLAEPVIPTDLT